MQGLLDLRPPTCEGVPHAVAALFEQLTLEVIKSGRKHYSARTIIERMRWHYDVEHSGGEFKINDHCVPVLARWFMRKHPRHQGFFETRRLRSAATSDTECADDGIR